MATLSYPTTSLQPGATGDAVKQLQDWLVSMGYMTQAQVNTGYGTYGPQTTAAVQKLQEDLGVDNSTGPGYWGPKTLTAVNTATSNGTTGLKSVSGGSSSTSVSSTGVQEVSSLPSATKTDGSIVKVKVGNGYDYYKYNSSSDQWINVAPPTGESSSGTASTATNTATETASTVSGTSTVAPPAGTPPNWWDYGSFDEYLKKAEEYYGYTIPTDQAAYQYPQAEANINTRAQTLSDRAIADYTTKLADINTQKQQLITDYNNYLDDLNTGKLRAGTAQQLQAQKALDDKNSWLQQQELTTKQNLSTLQRGWIGKGGLYSGVFQQAQGQFGQEANLQKQNYLTNYTYEQQTQNNAYQQALQDYATKQQRATEQQQTNLGKITTAETAAQTAEERSLQDIAYNKLKDIKSLQDTYSQAVMGQAGQNQYFDWRKAYYGA